MAETAPVDLRDFNSPESQAIAQREAEIANYRRAQEVAVAELEAELNNGNVNGLGLGVLLKRLGKYGISEHVASQAIDAMRGRTLRVSDLGKISLRR